MLFLVELENNVPHLFLRAHKKAYEYRGVLDRCNVFLFSCKGFSGIVLFKQFKTVLD